LWGLHFLDPPDPLLNAKRGVEAEKTEDKEYRKWIPWRSWDVEMGKKGSGVGE
jgi:hypothetical protein